MTEHSDWRHEGWDFVQVKLKQTPTNLLADHRKADIPHAEFAHNFF